MADAAVIGYASNPSPFRVLAETVARRIDEVSGRRFGDWLKDSTGWNPPPAFLSGADFGVVRALQSNRLPPSLGDMLIETVNYAIDEARERLAAFVSGAFIPETIHDLYDYLKQHSFELETRINDLTGEVANFLVDKASRQAVPAAQVDPSLAHANVLRLDLRTRLREQIGRSEAARSFDSWGGMDWIRTSVGSKYGYTVQGGQGYFGRIVGIVGDEKKTEGLLAECGRRGIDVIVPRDAGGKPVPGMPVLARHKSMKAEDVDAGLSHDRLAASFGSGMVDHFKAKAEREARRRFPDRVASKVRGSEFEAMFLSRRDIGQASAPSGGYGFEEDLVDRDIVIRATEEGGLYAWDRSSASRLLASVRALPHGEYERLDEDGRKVGYTTVDEGGRLDHYDLDHAKSGRVSYADSASVAAPSPN